MKAALKKARRWGPLNRLATGTVKKTLSVLDLDTQFFVRHLPRVGTIDVRLPNARVLRLQSDGDDWVPNLLYWRGWDGYEPEAVRVFFALARRARVTLDVGAFVGIYALLASHANRAGRVFAFEPFRKTYDRLVANVRLNDATNVETVCAAIGDTDTESAVLYYEKTDTLPLSCSMSSAFVTETSANPELATVEMMTLDRFVEEHRIEAVDLVKIDTESTEAAVLRGMRQTLVRHRPSLLVEVLGHTGTADELQRILQPLGYRFYHLTPEGPVRKESIEPEPPWDNYLVTALADSDVDLLRDGFQR